jgi:hypothetical protein
MRGTRRTIVAAVASLAVVLGVGGVAAATSGHGSQSDDPASETSTSVTGVKPLVKVAEAHDQRGKGPESRHVLGATSTTVDETTSSTIEDDTGTTLGSTPTTVDRDDDHQVCDHEGDKDADHDEAEHACDNSGRRVGPTDGRAVGANLDHDGPRRVGSTDGRKVGSDDRGHDGDSKSGSNSGSNRGRD